MKLEIATATVLWREINGSCVCTHKGGNGGHVCIPKLLMAFSLGRELRVMITWVKTKNRDPL